MVKLALEIPLRYWDEFSSYSDYHYALTHEVLSNKSYARQYRNLRGEVWLDNSFNELKKTVSLPELLKACQEIGPTHLVLPEAEEPILNIQLVDEAVKTLDKEGIKLKTVAAWRGGVAELEDLETLVDIVALPYDEPRGWLLSQIHPLKWSRYHFFGFNTLSEVNYFKPRSIDTSTPIRLALFGRDIDFEFTRPTLPYYDPKIKMTKAQRKLAHTNLWKLKKVLE